MKYFIKTNILPGSMFVVKQNDVKEMSYSNGTKGYFSYILGTNDSNPNIIYNNIILTKKGLKGKDRLTTGTLITVFYTCINEEVNEIILDKNYQYIPVTTHELLHTDVHSLNPVDFFGWLLSKAQLYRKLDSKHHSSLLNIVDEYGNGKHLYIFEYETILSLFTQQIEDLFTVDDLTIVLNKFFTTENKNKLLYELCNKSSLFILPYYDYILNMLSIENSALSYILNNIQESNIQNKDLYIKEIILLQLELKTKRSVITEKITSKLDIIKSLRINYKL